MINIVDILTNLKIISLLRVDSFIISDSFGFTDLNHVTMYQCYNVKSSFFMELY
jgi:hypothetical protein